MHLVLSFSQSDARAFTPAHAEALGAMAASGFGFALEDVTDLEMDFGKLKALGFEFIKLDAEVFLDGMQAPGGCIPASDICRYLSDFGLSLIVGSHRGRLAARQGDGLRRAARQRHPVRRPAPHQGRRWPGPRRREP